MTSPADELLLTASQVAALFGVGRKTINRWTDQGRLPIAATTPAGHPRYRHHDINHLMATAIRHTRWELPR